MGGRYKNVNGQAVWEELPEGVTAPNQIEPGASAAPGGVPSMPRPPAPPPGGMPGGGWGSPGSRDYYPDGQRPGQPGAPPPIPMPPGGFGPDGNSEGPGGLDGRNEQRRQLPNGGIAPYAPEPTPMQSMPAPPTGGKGPELKPGDPGYGIPAPGNAPPAMGGSATGAPGAPGTNAGTAAAPGNRPAPPGFDANKWQNQNDRKYNVGRLVDQMVADGASNEQIMQEVLRRFPDARQVGSDSISWSGGNDTGIYDLIFDSDGTGRRAQYTGVGDVGGAGGGSPSVQGFPSAGGHSGAPSGMPGSAPGMPGGGGDFNSQVRAALLGQMGQAGAPVTAEDPIISRQFEAQSNVLERNRRDRRAADAERAAMNGLLSGGQSSGSFEQNVASGFEDKANAQSEILSGLMGRELQARRAQMTQLLQMAIQTGDADLERSLRYQLAQMDLQFQRDRWNDDFGLRASEALYGRDRDLAMYGGGGAY